MPEFRQRWSAPRDEDDGPPVSPARAEPRPETLAEGTLLLWLWGSLLVFGGFLVVVPGLEGGQTSFLVVGILLVVVSLPLLGRAVRDRLRFLRSRA